MFTVRPFESKTLLWWLAERDEIDMSPVYQRKGGIWTKTDKAFLVDSILNEFDIPKFYIADFTYVSTPLNHNNRKFAVIDGKQRFEAIFDFFDGNVTLSPQFEYSIDPTLKLSGLSYKDLKNTYPKIAGKFENFNLSVMSVITDDEAKISELFVRLNNSKSLSGPEIRNAMQGIVPVLIRRISGHNFFARYVAFNLKRMQGHNVAGKLLLIEHRGKLVDTKKANIDRLVAEEGVRSENTDFERAAIRVEEVLERMTQIFNPGDVLLKSQGPITIYYWLTRNMMPHQSLIREFLISFEAQRKANRTDRSETAEIDVDFADYDLMNRATNDQGSLQGRYNILVRKFAEFLTKRGINISVS